MIVHVEVAERPCRVGELAGTQQQVAKRTRPILEHGDALAEHFVFGELERRARRGQLRLDVEGVLELAALDDLDAVDVAFTEAAVGAGVTTVLLLSSLRLTRRWEAPPKHNPLLSLLVVGVTGAALVYATLDAPLLGDPNAPVHKHVTPHYIQRAAEEIGMPNVFIKDEGVNPTGSFKARGLVMAVSRAYELGATELAIPSAGNAAGAMSAYAAAAGLGAHVFMPQDVPDCFRVECEQLGAHVTLVDGLITDCGDRMQDGVERHGWFPLSTLKEPYRIEGKKTMGYEVAEQLDWTLPDVIIYPTGGGTGLVGMWKAFEEMEQMYGGMWDFEIDPEVAAKKMIAHIDKKRSELGIDRARERIMVDMAARRELESA